MSDNGDNQSEPYSHWESPTVPPSLLRPGSRLSDRYEVLEMVGRGGMGEAWKAFDPVRKLDVVIKLLPQQLMGNEAASRSIQESFCRVNKLQHQHICPVYDLGQDPLAGHFQVMKYLPGETLSTYRFRQTKDDAEFPLARVISVLRPIAAALDYAHQEKIVHRDVTMQNIMLNTDGTQPQLVDFGLADEIRSSFSRITGMHVDVSGTFPYMAPEQWRGRQQDGRTDQYALAVISYILITGHPPFESPDREIMRLCVLEETVPEIARISPEGNEVLKRALAKSPEDRFSNCTRFIDSLESALVGPEPQKVTATFPSENRRETNSHRQDAAHPGRSGSWWKETLFTSVLVGVIGLAGWIFREDLMDLASANPSTNQSSSVIPTNVTPSAGSPASPPGTSTGGDPRSTAAPNSPQPVTATPTPAATATPTPSTNSPSPTQTSNNGTGATGATPAAVAASSPAQPQTGAPDSQLVPQLLQAKATADQAKLDASRGDVQQYAVADWKEAERLLTQANLQYANAQLDVAIESYREAARTYYLAIDHGQKVRAFTRSSRESLKELAELRSQAESMRNGKSGSHELAAAEKAYRELEAAYNDRDYLSAAQKLEEARTGFQQSIALAKAEREADLSRSVYESTVSGIDAELLSRHGGAPWKEARERIQQAESENDFVALDQSYRAGVDVLTTIRGTIRENEIEGMIQGEDHRQVLDLLWPEWETLTPEMRRAFLDAAMADPTWWMSKATEEVAQAELQPEFKAMLYFAVADGQRLRKDEGEVGRLMELARAQAIQVSDPRTQMELWWAMAEEMVDRKDPTRLKELITEVQVGLNSISGARNDSKARDELKFVKYYVPLRCAILQWKAGDKRSADEHAQLAHASAESMSLYNYDLPAFQAIMVFAAAGDWANLKRMQHIRDGRVHIINHRHDSTYRSLQHAEIFQISRLHSVNETYPARLEILSQTEIALAAARSGDETLYRVHRSVGDSMLKGLTSRSLYGAWLISLCHGKLAMAEAYQNDFVAAGGRLRSSVTDSYPLAEAALVLGRRQLAAPLDTRGGGVEGAKATLELFAKHPQASVLAQEISASIAKTDLSEAIQWMNSLELPHLKIAAKSGLAQVLKSP